jgi:ribosomal-protein-alanine N-acetyltransferase
VLLSYAFHELGLRRVEASYLPENEASGKVLAKLGMRHEGVRRQYVVKDGGLRDLVVRSIVAEEVADGIS